VCIQHGFGKYRINCLLSPSMYSTCWALCLMSAYQQRFNRVKSYRLFLHRAWSWQTLSSVAVRAVVGLLSDLFSDGFCQSGCCQSGCCQSGCCQSGCCQSGCSQSHSLASRQSRSVTKLLQSSILVIYTARNLPITQLCDNAKATQNPVGRTGQPKQRLKL